MNTPLLSLNDNTRCSCNNPQNNRNCRPGLDSYNGDNIIITYFDPKITDNQKENVKFYIPTDSTNYFK